MTRVSDKAAKSIARAKDPQKASQIAQTYFEKKARKYAFEGKQMADKWTALNLH